MKADAPKPDSSMALSAEKRAEIGRAIGTGPLFQRLFGTAGRRASLKGGTRRPAIAGSGAIPGFGG